jgi:hypothetical protein
MLTTNQIKEFSRLLKINESVVIREYIQTLFLKELYDEKYSQYIFFKGGTAIRLILEGTRFSEDLDFTVMGYKEEFSTFILKFFKKLEKLYGFSFKKRKTITGDKYLLTADLNIINYKIFINLDFSFREKVINPSQSIVNTNYPVIFTAYVNHLSAEEILAEKIRATLTRDKGRDIYDLWFLLSKNIFIDEKLVEEKLKYYNIKTFMPDQLIAKINKFSKEKFVLDLKPFVPIDQRDRLLNFYDYILTFIKEKLN